MANFFFTEEPLFATIKKIDEVEIREYEPTLVARVEVQGDFDSAGSIGFRLLADFIFGNNRSKTQLSMTSPVAMSGEAAIRPNPNKPPSEKISMTAPVAMSAGTGPYWVEFTMPREYTMATLPEPVNPRVKIVEVPKKMRAVLRYSGSWSQEKFLEKRDELLKRVQQAGYTPHGDPILARFDPPFIPWFLRHNEVWQNLEPSPQGAK